MQDYGVWSEVDGGFLITQCWYPKTAQAELDRLMVEDGYGAEELKVLPVCEYHEDQPAGDCDECDSEESEGE